MTYTVKIGSGVARCGDVVAQSSRDLARKLVFAGAEDGPVEAMRGDRVRSLHAFARTALVENPRLRVVPYRDVAAAFKKDATP